MNISNVAKTLSESLTKKGIPVMSYCVDEHKKSISLIIVGTKDSIIGIIPKHFRGFKVTISDYYTPLC